MKNTQLLNPVQMDFRISERTVLCNQNGLQNKRKATGMRGIDRFVALGVSGICNL
jgi:hypothetical protein